MFHAPRSTAVLNRVFFFLGDNVGLFGIDSENNLIAIRDLNTLENEYTLQIEARDAADHLTTHNIKVWNC